MRIRSCFHWVMIGIGLGISTLDPVRAFAHAHLESAEPGRNATIHQAPQRVILHYSEELEPAVCKVEVQDAGSGQVVSEGKPQASGPGARALEIALQALPNRKAVYEVRWKAVSRDSHRTQGSYRFTYDPGTR